MQFTIVFTSAVLLFGQRHVSAQSDGFAIVENACSFMVYVQSFPFDGSAAGPLTSVPAKGRYVENFRPSGSTIKLARDRTLTSPLFFGYSFSENPDYAYYELSSEFGNPFDAFPNSLSPGEGCMSFHCDANQAGCYSTPESKKVNGCPQPLNVTASLCA